MDDAEDDDAGKAAKSSKGSFEKVVDLDAARDVNLKSDTELKSSSKPLQGRKK